MLGPGVALQPNPHRGAHKRQPVVDLLRQASISAGYGNLTMMTIERAEMKLLGSLDQIRTDQQSLDIVFRRQVLDNCKVGKVPGYREKLPRRFEIAIG